MTLHRPMPEATPRKKPSLMDKLAACLLRLWPGVVKSPETKTAKQIVSEFDCDHVLELALGGSNHPANLEMLPRGVHRAKSARRKTAISKTTRLRAVETSHREAMTAKQIGDDPPRDVKRNRIAQRPNPWPPKGSRKMNRRQR